MAKKTKVPWFDPRDEAREKAPTGFAAMRHPQCVGCGFAGREYKPDAEGVVLVPVEAVSQLLADGFAPVEEPAVRAPSEDAGTAFDNSCDMQIKRVADERLAVGANLRADGGSRIDRSGGQR